MASFCGVIVWWFVICEVFTFHDPVKKNKHVSLTLSSLKRRKRLLCSKVKTVRENRSKTVMCCSHGDGCRVFKPQTQQKNILLIFLHRFLVVRHGLARPGEQRGEIWISNIDSFNLTWSCFFFFLLPSQTLIINLPVDSMEGRRTEGDGQPWMCSYLHWQHSKVRLRVGVMGEKAPLVVLLITFQITCARHFQKRRL